MLQPQPPPDLSGQKLLEWGKNNLSGLALLTFFTENGFRQGSKPDTRSRDPLPEWVQKLPRDEQVAWCRANNHA
jgi:hypothetical protein